MALATFLLLALETLVEPASDYGYGLEDGYAKSDPKKTLTVSSR